MALSCQLDLSENIIPYRLCSMDRFTGIFRGGRWKIRVAYLDCIGAEITCNGKKVPACGIF